MALNAEGVNWLNNESGGGRSDDFADLAWAMLIARLNNDRSPTLQSEVHADLVIRDSTISYAGSPVTEAVP
jgi:hypothetical protein